MSNPFQPGKDGKLPRWDKVKVTTTYVGPQGPIQQTEEFDRASTVKDIQDQYDETAKGYLPEVVEEVLGVRPNDPENLPDYEQKVLAFARGRSKEAITIQGEKSNSIIIVPPVHVEVELVDVASLII